VLSALSSAVALLASLGGGLRASTFASASVLALASRSSLACHDEWCVGCV